MENYREQDGCHNCQHVFEKYDYDEPTRYYCTLNAPTRPLCLSVSMKEAPESCENYSLSEEERDALWSKACADWYAWEKARKTEAYGICDGYLKKENQS